MSELEVTDTQKINRKPFDEIESYRKLYSTSHHIVRFIGRALLGAKVRGGDNIPEEGAALIASKHVHWLEIFLLPTAIDRHVSPLAREGVLEFPIIGALFKKWGAIPLPREDFGARGRPTWREARRRLGQGRLVPMFPEGTRTPGRMGELRPGIARLALAANVITIPAATRGADSFPQALLRRTITEFGEAIDPPTDKSDEAIGIFLTNLQTAIVELYEKEDPGIIDRLKTFFNG